MGHVTSEHVTSGTCHKWDMSQVNMSQVRYVECCACHELGISQGSDKHRFNVPVATEAWRLGSNELAIHPGSGCPGYIQPILHSLRVKVNIT